MGCIQLPEPVREQACDDVVGREAIHQDHSVGAVRKNLVHHDQQGIQFRIGRSPRMLKVVRIPKIGKLLIDHKSAVGALDRRIAQRAEPRVGLRNGCSQVGGERVGLFRCLCDAGRSPPSRRRRMSRASFSLHGVQYASPNTRLVWTSATSNAA
jgi:hypothetical protein